MVTPRAVVAEMMRSVLDHLLPPTLPPPDADTMKNLRNQYAPAPALAAAPLVPADLLSDKIMALEKACISVLEEHLPQPALLRRSSREGQFLAPALAPALAPSSASSSHDGGADLIVQLNRLQAQLLVVKSCLAEQRRPQQQQRWPSGEQRRPSGEPRPPPRRTPASEVRVQLS